MTGSASRAGQRSPVALIRSRCGLWLAYWRLRPLWSALLQAVPDVELPAGQRCWRGVRWRLLRRVIEIRDAELALRPYWRADVAERAVAAARAATLSPELEQAVVEAAVIMDAVSARLRGMPPSPGPVPVHRVCATAGDDLHSEVARLVQVARIIRRCPAVRELTARAAGPPLPACRRPAAGRPGLPPGYQAVACWRMSEARVSASRSSAVA
jgi:hypothetical protein